MDGGPVIIQAAVPVNPGEKLNELMQRVHAMEHRIYPQAIQWFAQNRISVWGREVHVTQGTAAAAATDGQWLVHPPLEEGF